MPQFSEAGVQRVFGIVHVGGVREIDRHNKRIGAALKDVHDPVLLATTAEPGSETEVRCEAVAA